MGEPPANPCCTEVTVVVVKPGRCQAVNVGELDRERLRQLLESSDLELAAECARAFGSGASVETNEDVSAPADHLCRIYRVRAEHVRDARVDAIGLDEAVVRFEAAGSARLIFAIVNADAREYILFVAADGSRVVACISVPR